MSRNADAVSIVRSKLGRLRRFFSVREMCLQELRAKWGRPVDTYRDRTDAALLHSLTSRDASTRTVDDATWYDLDMDALFDRLDGTTTRPGRQYLYRRLRTYEPDEAKLERQHTTSALLLECPELREEIQLRLWRLRGSNASAVTVMLFGELPDGHFNAVLAVCLAATSSVSIVVALLFPSLFWLAILPVAANFLFAEMHSRWIGEHSMGFVQLRNLLIVAHRLSKLDTGADILQLNDLKRDRAGIRGLRRRFRFVGVDSTSGNLFAAQIAYLANLICLFDFLVFTRCARNLAEHKEALCGIFDTVASLDGAAAVGSYLAFAPARCHPRFGKPGEMRFEGITHPLLDDAVPNDYCADANSALITGSNMAGKSTFIKAIGTNLILAQTLWLCHARSALVPKASVMSSIKRSDSLAEGKSYYFAEIEALLRLIVASEERQPHVFLIDEILHGTNTVERIASAAAVLERISRKHVVMVTTHDVELSRFLPDRYRPFHFRETTDVGTMFDYRLRDGPVRTRNAIMLLEAIGFPADVIGVARRIASELDSWGKPEMLR